MRPLPAALILAFLVAPAMAASPTQSHPLSEVRPMDIDLNMSGQDIFNVTELRMQDGFLVTRYEFRDDTNTRVLAFNTSEDRWEVVNSDLDLNDNNIENFFSSSCSGDDIVKQVYANGSYNCVDPATLGTTEDFQQTLNQGNWTGGFDINMTGSEMLDFFANACSGDSVVKQVYPNGSYQCESVSSLAGDTDNQTLAQVLSEGNSAGSYNINLSSNNLTQVGWVMMPSGVRIGDNSTSVSANPESVAVGQGATTVGGGVALGSNADAANSDSTALGFQSYAGGEGSVAIGWWARADDPYTVTLGRNSITEAWHHRYNLEVTGNATLQNRLHFGGNLTIGDSSTEASAPLTTAIGRDANASRKQATAVGHSASAKGFGAQVAGYSASASSGDSVALGSYADVSGYGGTALGYSSEAKAKGSVAIGKFAVAPNPYEATFGAFGTDGGGNPKELDVNVTGNVTVHGNDGVTTRRLEDLRSGQIELDVGLADARIEERGNENLQIKADDNNRGVILKSNNGATLQVGSTNDVAGSNGYDILLLPTSSGDVGIGTENPSQFLEVAGTTNITGNLTVSGIGGIRSLSGDIVADDSPNNKLIADNNGGESFSMYVTSGGSPEFRLDGTNYGTQTVPMKFQTSENGVEQISLVIEGGGDVRIPRGNLNMSMNRVVDVRSAALGDAVNKSFVLNASNVGSDDQTLAEVLTQGNVANTAINMSGNNLTGLERMHFNGNIIIGNGSTTTGAMNSMSIGRSASADGSRSVAIGQGSTADNGNAVALGYRARAATSNDAVAIGSEATTNGRNDAMAIGRLASANGRFGVALGYQASYEPYGGIAIGPNSDASGSKNNIALGGWTVTGGEGSVAIGVGSKAPNSFEATIGRLTSDDPWNGPIDLNVTGNVTIHGIGGLDFADTKGANHRITGFFDSACPTDYAVADIYDNGTYRCINTVDVGQDVENLNQTLLAGNLANQSIGMTGNDITGLDNLTFKNGIAIGDGAFTANSGSLAIGTSADTPNKRQIAIGSYSDAGNNENIAIGYNSSASNYQSTAIGTDTRVLDRESVALGRGAIVQSSSSLALGTNSLAGDTRAVAIGHNAEAQLNAVAIGKDTVGGSPGVIVIGHNAQAATNYQAISIGRNSQASGQDSVALGESANTQQDYAIALGPETTAQDYGSVAIGINASSPNAYEATFGNLGLNRLDVNMTGNVTIHGTDGLNVVNGNILVGGTQEGQSDVLEIKKSSDREVAIGTNNPSSANRGVAIGHGASASAGAVTIGPYVGDAGTGGRSVSIGWGANSQGFRSIAIGLGAGDTGGGEYAIAIGDSADSPGNAGIALGRRATAAGNGSVAIGNNSVAPNNYEATFGNLGSEKLDVNVTGNLTVHGLEGLTVENGDIDLDNNGNYLWVDNIDSDNGIVDIHTQLRFQSNELRMSGQPINMGGGKIQNLVSDSLGDAVNKSFVLNASNVGTDDQTLAEVLTQGNDAGSNSIDLDHNNLINVSSLRNGTSDNIRLNQGGDVEVPSGELQIIGTGLRMGSGWGSQVFIQGSQLDIRDGDVEIEDGNLNMSFNNITDCAYINGIDCDSLGGGGSTETLAETLNAGFRAGTHNISLDSNELLDAGGIRFNAGIEIGDAATSTAQNNHIAIGRGAVVNNVDNSMAVGDGAVIFDGWGSEVAVGHDANVSGGGSTAVGRDSYTRDTGSAVFGYSAGAEQADTTALGYDTLSTDYGGTVVGYQAETRGSGSTAVGIQSSGWAADSVAIGNQANTTGWRSVALGKLAEATREGSVAMGFNSTSPNQYEATFGNLGSEKLDVNITGNLTVHGLEGLDFAGSNQQRITGFFDSECGTDEAVKRVYPNGTYLCTSTIDTGQDVENLNQTLEAGNLANQSIGMTGHDITGVGNLTVRGRMQGIGDSYLAGEDSTVIDGGFERGDSLYWSMQNSEVTSSIAQQGRYSLNITSASSGGGHNDIYQVTPSGPYVKFDVRPGQVYAVQGWVYSTAGSDAADIGIREWNGTKGHEAWTQVSTNTGTGSWEFIRGYWTVPSGTQYATVWLRGDDISSGGFNYFDNIRVYRVDSPEIHATDGTLEVKDDADLENNKLIYSSGGVEVGNGSTTTGRSLDVAIGKSANASSSSNPYYNIALGPFSEATGVDRAVAVGTHARATRYRSTAVGGDADATNVRTTAIGQLTNASGDSATAVGYGSQAGGTSDVALGYFAEATGGYGISMGWSTNAAGCCGAAIGTDANYTSNNAIAIGRNTLAGGSGGAQVAMGYNANATGAASVAIGFNALSDASHSVAIGADSLVKADNYGSIVLGDAMIDNTDFTDNKSILIGDGIYTNEPHRSIAIGPDTYLGSDTTSSVVIGDAASTGYSGERIIAIGSGAVAGDFAYSSIAIGTDTYTYGEESIAIGNESTAQGDYSVALGPRAVTETPYSASDCDYGISIGYQANCTADGALAIGANAEAPNQYEATFGNLGSEKLDVNVTGALTVHGEQYFPNGVAIGDSATSASTDARAVAIGSNADANAAPAVSIGSNSDAATAGDIALGISSLADGGGALGEALAVGFGAEATASRAVAIGEQSRAPNEAEATFGAFGDPDGDGTSNELDVNITGNLTVHQNLQVNGGTKNFVEQINSTHEVVYTSSESGEVVVDWDDSTFVDGDGTRVSFPRHLELVMSTEEDYHVTATPVESLADVGVFDKNDTGFTLEASEPTEVDFEVSGVRKGYEDKKVLRK